MPDTTRAEQLIDTFATLADTLVEGYDVVDLLQTLVDTCHTVLNASAAGILLAEERGRLDLLASTTEGSELVELLHVGGVAGPGAESFAGGVVVEVTRMADSPPPWDAFRRGALSLGFQSAVAIPMRLRETTIGVLTLFAAEPGEFSPRDLQAGRALADVATIGILHERTLRESSAVQQHLTHALNSRIVIEQAKGIISQTHALTMDEAFTLLRGRARSSRIKLSDVARAVVDRSLTL